MNHMIFAGLPEFKRDCFLIGLPETITDMKSLVAHIFAKLELDINIGLSKLRTKEYATGRMIAMGILLKTHKLTLKQVGTFFNRDHSTVIYNRDLFDDLLEVKDSFLLDKLRICGFENLTYETNPRQNI